jgi:hypothetical protein
VAEAFDGGLEVAGFCVRDFDKCLRVEVGERKPCALDLNHDAVSLEKGVIDFDQ